MTGLALPFCCQKHLSHLIECTLSLSSNHLCDNRMAETSTPLNIQPEESRRTIVKVKICRRCGEEGHYINQCTTNCPNCDGDHPPGSCPTTKVTCFLYEGHDHCPKECRLYQMITKSIELQQWFFHTVVFAESKSKAVEESHKRQKTTQLASSSRSVRPCLCWRYSRFDQS